MKNNTANMYKSLGDNNLANVYLTMESYDHALTHYDKFLKLLRAPLGDDHLIVGDIFQQKGMIYLSKKEYPKASDYFRNALNIYEPHYGSNDENVQRLRRTVEALTEQPTVPKIRRPKPPVI